MAFDKINTVIEYEVQNNLSRLNGDNQKKEGLPKSLKGTKEWEYISTSRTMVRLWWMMKYVTDLFTNVVDQTDFKMSKCAQEAYKSALEEHHPWALKQAAKLAMGLIPSRTEVSTKLRVPYL